MDCRHALSLLAALSADGLAAKTASELREHFHKCPECQHEWVVFEATLLVVSSTTQRIPAAWESQKMWHACSQEIHQRIEQRRVEARKPKLFNWAARQPRLGWAAFSGALAVLGSVWMLAPQANGPRAGRATSDNSLTLRAASDVLDSSDAGPLVTLGRPSPGAATLVNHHTAMAFDPFPDHVGSTLISSSATTSVASQQRSATPGFPTFGSGTSGAIVPRAVAPSNAPPKRATPRKANPGKVTPADAGRTRGAVRGSGPGLVPGTVLGTARH